MHDNKNVPLILLAIGLVIAIGAAVYFWTQSTEEEEPDQQTTSINSFDECVNAGYPVMESYPRQCRTPDGRNFVEVIPEPIEPPAGDEAICVDNCGDGTCAEIVCLGTGCPCVETPSSCPADCPAQR